MSNVKTLKRISFSLLPFAFYLGIDAAEAQQYPSRPIRLIMPNAPGSSADTMGRIVAIRLGEALGQQVVVDNRAGAGGSLGLEIGKNANADGASCARHCAKGGAQLVLFSEGKLYKLSDQATALAHVGHKVMVTGTLTEEGQVTVVKIEELKDKA